MAKIQNEKADELVQLGFEFYRKGQYYRAIQNYEKALKIKPNYDKAFREWAKTLAAMGQYKEAARKIQKAIKSDSKNEYNWQEWAEILLLQEKYNEANEKYEEAVRLSGNHMILLTAWARALIKQNKIEEANEKYETAAKQDPVDELLIHEWAQMFVDLGKYARANKIFENAISHGANLDHLFHMWGLSLEDQGDLEAAIEKYRQAIERNPKEKYSWHGWGRILKMQKKYKQAIENFRKALTVDEKYAPAWSDWGDILLIKKKYSEAVEKYTKAASAGPQIEWYWRYLGDAYVLQKNYQQAIENYEKAAELAPKDGYNRYKLGNVHCFLKNYAEASENYEKATNVWPDYARAWVGWAQALEQSGNSKEAQSKYRKALELFNQKEGGALQEQGELREREKIIYASLGIDHFSIPNVETEDNNERQKNTDESKPKDDTELIPDNPTNNDLLGRDVLAQMIAWRFRRIHEQKSKEESSNAFMVHLHGPWGSGKSSLFQLIKEELEKKVETAETAETKETFQDWRCIEFNAWKNQHVRPVWWALYDSVYLEAVPKGRPWLLLRARGRRWYHRMSNRAPILPAALITGIIVAVYLMTGGLNKKSSADKIVIKDVERTEYTATTSSAVDKPLSRSHYLETIKETNGAKRGSAFDFFTVDIEKVAKFLSVFGVLYAIVINLAKILFPASPKLAEQFMENSSDPMQHVKNKYKTLMDRYNSPTLVFIDDLDRCESKYTVELLERLQTLFGHRNVIYLIAADRRWLYTSYETIYKDFAGGVKEPGKQLGAHFLEKAFQLSVSVPRLSDFHRTRFFSSLLNIQENISLLEKEAEDDFTGVVDESEARKKIEDAKNKFFKNAFSDDINKQENLVFDERTFRQVYQKKALSISAPSKKSEEKTEHFLLPFAACLEPNPRGIKRLLNAFIIQKTVAGLSGLDIYDETLMKQLALWTILIMRWPRLESLFEKEPELINAVVKINGGAGRSKKIPSKYDITDNSLLFLLEKDFEVAKVILGKEVNVALEPGVVRTFASLCGDAYSGGEIA